jgi:hypothetical protein
MGARITILAVAGAMMTTTGCGPSHQQVMTFLRGHQHSTAGAAYQLQPPDVIKLEAPQAPELDGLYRIQADGTIQNRLLGSVRVVGLTPREAAAKLQQLLQHYYKEPVVNLSVARYASKVIYMYGELAGIGVGGVGTNAADRSMSRVPVTGRDTILDVLTAHPPSANAWLNHVRIIRPDPNDPDKNQEIKVDVEKLIKYGDLRHNVLLQDGDIVAIPPTPQAWLGHRVRELLQPVNPMLQAYTAPAAFDDANDQYHGDDDDSSSSSLLGRF